MALSTAPQRASPAFRTSVVEMDSDQTPQQQLSHQDASLGLYGETAAVTPFQNVTLRRKQGTIGTASPRDFSIRIRAPAQQAQWRQPGQAKGPVLVGQGAAAARDAAPGPGTPTMGRLRREGLSRRAGTGRQCTGRGFTLCIMALPVPCPPTTVAKTPAPSRRTPTPTPMGAVSSGSTDSGLPASASPLGTPMEGVPERLMFKTPAVRSRLGQTLAAAAAATPGLEGMTPMEGVPERPFRRAPATVRKLLRADAAAGSLPRLQRGRNSAPTPAALLRPVFSPGAAVSSSSAGTSTSAGGGDSRAVSYEPAQLRGSGEAGTGSDDYGGGNGGYSEGEEATPPGGKVRSRWELPTAERHAWGGGEWGRKSPESSAASPVAGAERQGCANDMGGRITDADTPAGPASAGVAARGSTGSRRSLRRISRSGGDTPSTVVAASGGTPPDAGGGTEEVPESSGYDAGGGWDDDTPESSGGPAAVSPALEVSRKRRGPAGELNQRLRKGIRKSLAGSGLHADNGVRRTSRSHHRPLEYWRNEKKVFARHYRSLPTVDHIETRTPEPSWPRPSARKSRKAGAATAK